jgi:hopanoid C-2 methylase
MPAFTLAQGPLVITAPLPTAWNVRFVDENMCRVDADNFRWANAVLVSGMRIQRRRSEDI